MYPYPRGPLSLLLICLAAVPLGAQVPRGVQLFDAGDWAGATTELAATIRRDDRDARAHYYLGRLAMLDDDADAAAAQFERAVALDDTIADYHLWYGAALSQQAGRASKLKQPSLATRVLSEFERVVALDPRSIEARDSLVDFYSMTPGFMGGGTDKARDQAQALARIDAARGHLAFARLAIAAKDPSTAEREMQAAIASAPNTFRPYSALANWYAMDGRWPEAFAALEFHGQRAESQRAIKQALTLDPRNEEAKKALR